jgi:T4 superinfection immunity protein
MSSITTIAIVFALYFLPTTVAAIRKLSNQGSLFVVNLFLGWTFIGWVVALAMAARTLPVAAELETTR